MCRVGLILMIVVLQSPLTRGGFVAPSAGTGLPSIVDWWTLQEESDGSSPVVRLGSRPYVSTINPGRIDLDDPLNIPSTDGIGGRRAVLFDGTKYLKTKVNDTAGQLHDITWNGGNSFTMFCRVKFNALTDSSSIFSQQKYEVFLNSGVVKFSSFAQDDTLNVVTSTVNLETGRWYVVCAGYDVVALKAFVIIIDDTGTVTRTENSSVPRRKVYAYDRLYIGGGHLDGLEGVMQECGYSKAAWTNGNATTFYNAGVPWPDGALNDDLAISNPTPVPYSNLQLVEANFDTTANRLTNGLYFYRPYPLHTWDPTLAATKGDYVWAHSTDHSSDLTHPSGLYLGYSDSPAVRPASWTHEIDVPVSGVSISGRTCVDAETPWLKYVPDDANGRPFYCYMHCDESGGFPAGLADSQETFLWTSADLETWVSEGVVLPTDSDVGESFPINHTGYGVIVEPDELPSVTNWQIYHLGFRNLGIEFVTQSADPKSFDTATNLEQLDYGARFPAGYTNITWRWYVFSPDGVKVYGLGTGFFPGGRGVCLCELAFADGAWRHPTGDIWELFRNTDAFPNIGYTQHVTGMYEAGVLHIYRLGGFYPQSGDERIDYWTLEI